MTRSSMVAAIVVFGACGQVVATAPEDVPSLPDGGQVGVPTPRCDGPRVRVVYFVPADRETVPAYTAGLRDGYAQLQAFFFDQLAGVRTFCFEDVLVLKTSHTASWYMANPSPRGQQYTLWDNTTADALAVLGPLATSSDTQWAYYFDVDYVHGQAIGSQDNLVMLPAKDLSGLAGNGPESRCATVGASGVFLAYAMGVRSPRECDTGGTGCDPQALMRMGWASFPNTYLLEPQKQTLAQSKFFVSLQPEQPVPSCD